MPDLPLSMPVAPEGFCNSLTDSNWVQNLLNLIGQGVAKFEGSGFTAIISQSTQPGVTDRDKLWYDTDVGRLYRFAGGAWVSPHPSAAGGDERRIWVGTLANLITYDGGSAGAVGDNSGPMWEQDTDFNDRIPMGVGPSLALAVSTNYGSAGATTTIAEANLPPHRHYVATNVPNAAGPPLVGANDFLSYSGGNMGNENYNLLPGNGVEPNVARSGLGAGTSSAFTVLNPVRGVYVIKRTARLNYVGS